MLALTLILQLILRQDWLRQHQCQISQVKTTKTLRTKKKYTTASKTKTTLQRVHDSIWTFLTSDLPRRHQLLQPQWPKYQSIRCPTNVIWDRSILWRACKQSQRPQWKLRQKVHLVSIERNHYLALKPSNRSHQNLVLMWGIADRLTLGLKLIHQLTREFSMIIAKLWWSHNH